MNNILDDLRKRYEECRLKGEIYLWQIHIIEHPEDAECYKEAIKRNMDELKIFELENPAGVV